MDDNSKGSVSASSALHWQFVRTSSSLVWTQVFSSPSVLTGLAIPTQGFLLERSLQSGAVPRPRRPFQTRLRHGDIGTRASSAINCSTTAIEVSSGQPRPFSNGLSQRSLLSRHSPKLDIPRVLHPVFGSHHRNRVESRPKHTDNLLNITRRQHAGRKGRWGRGGRKTSRVGGYVAAPFIDSSRTLTTSCMDA